MINITLRELLESKNSLTLLIAEKLPAITSFKINKIVIKCESNFKSLQVATNVIIEKYGIKDEKGEFKKINPAEFDFEENTQMANEEYDQLLLTSIDIDEEKIDINLLASVNIEPVILAKLMWMFN